MTAASIDTQADVERTSALVREAVEMWRSAERDLDSAGSRYGEVNTRMLSLAELAKDLETRCHEASKAACLALVQEQAHTKLFGDAEKIRDERNRTSAAVQYVATVMMPALRVAEVSAKLQERRSAQRYHSVLAELETAKAVHAAVSGGLADSGVMLDMEQSKAARYQAAAVEISREVERLQAELNSL